VGRRVGGVDGAGGTLIAAAGAEVLRGDLRDLDALRAGAVDAALSGLGVMGFGGLLGWRTLRHD
jgi:hypothetical protein